VLPHFCVKIDIECRGVGMRDEKVWISLLCLHIYMGRMMWDEKVEKGGGK